MRYVFNYTETEGYLFRAPLPVAALICWVADRRGRTWDYGTWEQVV